LGALVRIVIQCWSSQDLAGNVNVPLNTAPAWMVIVSPQFAELSAPCRLPPAETAITVPGDGVAAIAV